MALLQAVTSRSARSAQSVASLHVARPQPLPEARAQLSFLAPSPVVDRRPSYCNSLRLADTYAHHRSVFQSASQVSVFYRINFSLGLDRLSSLFDTPFLPRSSLAAEPAKPRKEDPIPTFNQHTAGTAQHAPGPPQISDPASPSGLRG